jgi:hypothetical protein
MENKNKTEGKTSTECVGVTETQIKKDKLHQDDGFGNEVQYMNFEDFQVYVTNKGLWCKGDQIQVKNSSGRVIATTILTEDGEAN